MNENFTLEDLAEFTKNENRIMAELGLNIFVEKTNSPSQQTVNNILNYSKALSIRETECIGNVDILLN